MKQKGRFVHVYVMRSSDNLVKVGISKNVVLRADNETLENERKKITAIVYSAEKIDIKMAERIFKVIR